MLLQLVAILLDVSVFQQNPATVLLQTKTTAKLIFLDIGGATFKPKGYTLHSCRFFAYGTWIFLL